MEKKMSQNGKDHASNLKTKDAHFSDIADMEFIPVGPTVSKEYDRNNRTISLGFGMMM